MALAQRCQRGAELGIEREWERVAACVLSRRARAIGGQFQQGRRVLQVVAPEVELALQQRPIEPAALPQAVVGVLDRQRRQRIGPALREGGVERAQFLDQHAHRPAVGHQMVQGDEQDMLLLAQAQQLAADQAVVGQVEGRARFLVGQTQQLGLGLWMAAEIVFAHVQADRGGGDDLHRVVLVKGDAGAQALVAGDDAVQCLTQGVAIQPAAQAQAVGHQVGQVGLGIELSQEPQALLGEGQRQRCAALGRHDGRQDAGGGGVQGLGQIGQAWVGEQRGQGQFQAERGADARDQPYRQQGVSAKGEEAVVATDLLDAEQLAPQGREQDFALAFGGDVGLRRQRIGIRRRQGAAVEFAVGGQRQGVQRHVGAGQHGVGQTRGQLRAQRVGGEHLGLANHVGDQARLVGVVLTQQHGGVAHAVAATQGGFDLAQFDAHAAQLDLIVVAAEIVQRAVGTPARHIARAVHALAGLLGERIGDEAFGGQIGTAQIAACQLHTGDLQFAGHADGRALPLCIEHVQLRIGDRPADRHAVGIGLGALPDADVHRRFGRAVEVVQACVWQALPCLTRQIRGQRLAATDDAPQAGAGAVGQGLEECTQHRGHEVHGVDAGLFDQVDQVGRILVTTRFRQHQTRAHAQRPEQFPHRHVEADRGLLQDALLGLQLQLLLHPLQAVVDGGMGVDHSLRLSGGAGGVDDVGRMLRVQCHRGRLGGSAGPQRGVGVQQHAVPIIALHQQCCGLAMGQQHAGPCIGEHGVETRGRHVAVQRQVRRACFEDSEQCHDQIDTARQAHGDTAFRHNAQRDQVVS